MLRRGDINNINNANFIFKPRPSTLLWALELLHQFLLRHKTLTKLNLKAGVHDHYADVIRVIVNVHVQKPRWSKLNLLGFVLQSCSFVGQENLAIISIHFLERQVIWFPNIIDTGYALIAVNGNTSLDWRTIYGWTRSSRVHLLTIRGHHSRCLQLDCRRRRRYTYLEFKGACLTHVWISDFG
jgi:hypothetical protein